jgi:hypothetical protein
MDRPLRVVRGDIVFDVVFDAPGIGRVLRDGAETGHSITTPIHPVSTGEQRVVLIELCQAAIDRLRGRGAL